MNIQDFRMQTKQRLKENKIKDASNLVDRIIEKQLHFTKTQLLIQSQKELTQKEIESIEKDIKKIEEHVPIQYIVGTQEFMKLSFYVNEHVLIPQPDTEILVESVIEEYKDKKVAILDLCTGSGAIAISLANYLPKATVVATDISEEALDVAKKNAQFLQVEEKIRFFKADIWKGLPQEKWDVIVSNPPYIETNLIKTLDLEVQKEPHIALDGGEDGLRFYRNIIKKAPQFLNRGGKVFLEIGYNQKEAVEKIATQAGFYTKIENRKDLAQNDRVIELSI